MDNWRYVERQSVTDPKGREWSVALMDILGQEGDPEMPSKLLELQYSSGRFFTLIYSATGVVVWERGYTSLPEATNVYERRGTRWRMVLHHASHILTGEPGGEA